MKKYLASCALLAWLVTPVHANETINLDAGELAGPLGSSMPVDNTSPSSNGALLLLIDLGSSNTLDNTVTPGNFVSGTNFVLAAGGFNTNGGTNETLTSFNVTTGTTGDELALRWFPQITYAQYQGGTLTLSGQYFGSYAPSPQGSTPDGGSVWTLPASGQTISLNFFTSNSDFGGSQAPSAGYASSQITSVPEPSALAMIGLSLAGLALAIRCRKVAL